MKKQFMILLFMWFGITSAMEESGVLTNSWITVSEAERLSQDADDSSSSSSSPSGYASANDYEDQMPILENPCFDMVVSLRRSLDTFAQNLFAALQQSSQDTPRDFLDVIQEIEMHIQSLSHFINQEKEIRLHTGKQCVTHDEITGLFNIALKKAANVTSLLTTPVHTDNQVRKALVSGTKLIETLYLFFGIIENNTSAYELCAKQFVMPLILKRVIKKPTHIDAVAERLFSRWRGAGNMVQRYQQDVYPRIQECAQAMECIYNRVGSQDQELSEQIKGLKKEIDNVHFSIYQNSRKYLKYADLLRRISEGPTLDLAEENDYRIAQVLERTLEDEREQEAILEGERKRLICERDNLYRNIFGLVSDECLIQETESGSLSSSVEQPSAALSTLLKSCINVDIVCNFISDLQGELVLKSGKRAYLMADISDRLQTGDQVHGLTNKATKVLYGRLLHFLYRGIECGYQHASTASKIQKQLETVSKFTQNLPAYYENYGAGIVRVAQMTKNSVDWTKYIFTAPVRAVAAPLRYFGNLWAPQQQPDDADSGKGKDKTVTQNEYELEKVKTTSVRVRKVVVCALSKDVGQTADHIKKIVAQMVDPASRYAVEHRREIISINAFAHMFKCMADPRTRNIGAGEFRQRFDQFAIAWNTFEELPVEQPELTDNEGLRRRNLSSSFQ